MQFKHLFLTITFLSNFLLTSFAQEPTLLEHGDGVRTVAFSPVNSQIVASAGEDNTIKLWNLKNGNVRMLSGHTGIINSIAFSPNGRLLASVSDDRTIKLWNVHNQRNIATLKEGTRFITIAFSPNGKLLATGGWQHVKLWNVQTRKIIATLQHDLFVQAVTFSHNGRFLAVGGGSEEGPGTVKVWNVQRQQIIVTLNGDPRDIKTVAFSPDDRYLASSGWDGQLKIWSVSNWNLLHTIRHTGYYQIAFSPDGQAIASTNGETISLSSVSSGEQIAALSGAIGWIHPLDFSPDNAYFAMGADDGFIRVYNIETHLQGLQQQDMVRVIYFTPRDRPARPDRVAAIRQMITDTQKLFADQMEYHGLDRKTFRVEANKSGNTLIHRITGKFDDTYYHKRTPDKVWAEIKEQFHVPKHVYLCFIDISTEVIGTTPLPNLDDISCGDGSTVWAGGGRELIIPASGHCFNVPLVAHELGHGFGLDHDFRNDTFIMSYGRNRIQFSKCAAEFLDTHRCFNANETALGETTLISHGTTIEMLPPVASPPHAVRLRFRVNDPDGLNQAQLLIPTTVADPALHFKIYDCRLLNSGNERIGFVTNQLTEKSNTEVILQVIDMRGSITRQTFPLDIAPLLSPSKVVTIPDPRLAAVIRETLSLNRGESITQLDMLKLTGLNATNQRISNLTGLEHAVNLIRLYLSRNRISDITPLAGLINLTTLELADNQIRDIQPLSKLRKINALTLGRNPIQDTSLLQTLNKQNPNLELDYRPKITGPWLWMIAPTKVGQGGANSNDVDSLAVASGGHVTEADVAANGAREGDAVDNLVWTLGEISATGDDNVTDLIHKIGFGRGDVDDHSSYALITLESTTVQSNVTMHAGSDDSIKIWLNGEVVHNNPINRGANDFRDRFNVDLNKGDNLLLVKVSERGGWWSMFVGIEADVNAVYKRPPDPVVSEDVNSDGIVNILDLVFVSSNFGKTGGNIADVNGDGIVNIVDLVKVAGEMGAGAAAPVAHPQTLEILTATDVQQWLIQAQHVDLTDITSQRGILILQQLLAALIPKETALLPNYPNPFNPETWIPYHLSYASDVEIVIYDVHGVVIRRLALGHQPTGPCIRAKTVQHIGMEEIVLVNSWQAASISIC